jgi:hypothetical protein
MLLFVCYIAHSYISVTKSMGGAKADNTFSSYLVPVKGQSGQILFCLPCTTRLLEPWEKDRDFGVKPPRFLQKGR